MAYKIPNRAKTLTTVASDKINENTNYIETALNETNSLASSVTSKIPVSEKGAAGGVATLNPDRKLTVSQLPEEAITHVYQVNSLLDQLNLKAVQGDYCKRLDISRTYILTNSDPTNFSSWMEIAAASEGGQIIGTLPYSRKFEKNEWILNDSVYSLLIESIEHLQGQTPNLIAFIKNENGEPIYSDYIVNSLGEITISSNVAYSGTILISNLQGNSQNTSFVPYSVNQGNYLNNRPHLYNFSLNQISLVTSPEITLIDGCGNIKKIQRTETFTIPESITDGIYYIFIDTEDINENYLSDLALIPESNYLGVVTNLPDLGISGQRAYLAFDKSYKHDGLGWKVFATTCTAVVTIKNKSVQNIYTLPYNQNNVNTNYLSSDKDYLYGPHINGLNYLYSDEKSFNILPGKCLDSTSKKIIELNQDLIKNLNSLWIEGNNQGGLDKEIIVETDPLIWYHIFIIGSPFLNTDILISKETSPILPSGYKYFRRICSIPYDTINKRILRTKQQKDKFYLSSPITQTLVDNIFDLTLPKIEYLTAILDIESAPNTISFKQSDDTLIFRLKESNDFVSTLQLSTSDNKLKVVKLNDFSLDLLGYIDERNL